MSTLLQSLASGPITRPKIPFARGFTNARSVTAKRNADTDRITYKVAECREEREAAFRLLYDAYVQAGLMTPHPYGMRVTPHHLLPTSDVLVAMHESKVIYTMSLVSDDQLGLPMESLYEQEIDELRQQGLYLAEVTCLASHPDCFDRGRMFGVFLNLVGLMFQYARSHDIDRLVIAVHPRHFRTYQRLLGFDQIGPQKPYAAVRNRPAVAAQHDFNRLDLEKYRLYDRVYARPFRRWELLRQPMLEDDRDFFTPVAELCGDLPVVVGA